MKKILIAFLCGAITLASAFGQSPSQTLGSLQAKGISERGGASKFAHFLMRTNQYGFLDTSFLDIADLFDPITASYYVDVTGGSDTLGNGSIASPWQTIQKAITENASWGGTPLVVYLAPGTYPGTVVVTNVNQSEIVLKGYLAQISGNFTITSAAASVSLTLYGTYMDATSYITSNSTLFTARVADASVITNSIAKSAVPTGTLTVGPGTTATAGTNMVVAYEVSAPFVTYAPAIPADWIAAPTIAQDAFDELAFRTAALESGTITGGLNVGTAGVGVFKQVNALNLEFYKINGLDDNIISVVLDAANSEVDLSLVAGSILNAKLANMNQYEIKGRITVGAGPPEDLTPTQVRTVLNVEDGANDYTHPNHTGDVTSIGDGAQTIVAAAVTNAKLADMAAWTIKGRNNIAAGVPEDITVATLTEGTPVDTDMLLGWKSTGELRKFDVANLTSAATLGVYSETTKDFTAGGPYEKIILVFVDTTSGNQSITPPAAADFNKIEILKKTATNSVTIIGTVNGVVNPTINTQYGRMVLLSDGASLFSPTSVNP